MSTGNLKPGFNADRHPDENQLLLALEREVPEEEIAEVERHLGTCWNCRARYHEMQRGILTFVEYRERFICPRSSPPPVIFGLFLIFCSLPARAVSQGCSFVSEPG